MSETVDPWVSEKQAAGEAGRSCRGGRNAHRDRVGVDGDPLHLCPGTPTPPDPLCGRLPESERLAREAGLHVEPFDVLDRLDLAVDGADQVASDLWLVKGGGGAHTRERVVAVAAQRFVVIVSANKLVEGLKPPVPLEVLGFGWAQPCDSWVSWDRWRCVKLPPPPDGDRLVDYLGPVGDPAVLATSFQTIPGVLSHGLFARHLVSEVIIGRGNSATERWRKES